MDEYISKAAAGFFFCFLFIAVTAINLLFASFDADAIIQSQNTKFINKCASTGVIDPVNYYTYASDVSKYGNYSIVITYDSLNYYNTEDGYKQDTLSYGTNEILDYMYTDSGEDRSWEMKSGDQLTIKVVKEYSDLTALWNNLVHGGAPMVIAEDSLVVGQQ